MLHPKALEGKPNEKFAHLVRHRNTFYRAGEDPAGVSAYLDVEMTSVQKQLVGPDAFDVDVRAMLRGSALDRGYASDRRKMAARTLNQAGLLNGKATMLTSEASLSATSWSSARALSKLEQPALRYRSAKRRRRRQRLLRRINNVAIKMPRRTLLQRRACRQCCASWNWTAWRLSPSTHSWRS